jgi:uncharacterized protein (UPF0218 family)
MAEVLLELPAEQRDAFKEPMGAVLTDAEELLVSAGEPLVAVGDVVTYHLEEAGRQPDVAVVDERTEREAVDDEVAAALREPDVVVENPPATLTRGLLSALSDAVASDESTTVLVDGEEDLATVPAVLVAPDGASVVYGQPGEGMVHGRVDEESRERMRELFGLLDGDHEAARAALGLA